MTTPDLTHITGLLLTQALDRLPERTRNGVRWSLSFEGGHHVILWRWDGSDWTEAADVYLTVDVKPRTPGAVVVGGVVYTGEEGVTA